jgi:two-component system nitrate/nitrite response regulator NarL
LILNLNSRAALLKAIELTLLVQKLVLLDLAGSIEASEDHSPLASADRSSGNATADSGLSNRELEILSCLAAGFSNRLIAHKSQISEATVKIHLRSILHKLKVQNRTQAAIWAVRHGLKSVSCGVVRLPLSCVPRRGV